MESKSLLKTTQKLEYLYKSDLVLERLLLEIQGLVLEVQGPILELKMLIFRPPEVNFEIFLTISLLFSERVRKKGRVSLKNTCSGSLFDKCLLEESS